MIELIIFILPAYFANASPVIFGGGKDAIDFNLSFNRERLFGKGKTIKGFLSGLLIGSLVGIALAFIPLYPFNVSFLVKIKIGFLLSLGALTGDLLGSFVKRRMRLKSGSPSFLLDQLPFIIFALIFIYPYSFTLSIIAWLFLITLSLMLHVFFNWLANKIGLKKVPW
ncbi:MAG: CDP-2,3-bis-(O-geranylgeranyl)-sn-glycerol synthase [Candidatus Marsarchaeota archaeon]|nr:CDP-2,3-bis-(O-geranylgeranyl)-sn-glycerol synthase [Candidatus Marsarchaeota archaeon]